MSLINVLLWVLGVYYAIGIVSAIRFVFFVAPTIDPVYEAASLRVRVLFLPGAVSIWPIILARSSALKKEQSETPS